MSYRYRAKGCGKRFNTKTEGHKRGHLKIVSKLNWSIDALGQCNQKLPVAFRLAEVFEHVAQRFEQGPAF